MSKDDNNERFLDPFDMGGTSDIKISAKVAKKLSDKEKSKTTSRKIRVEKLDVQCPVCKENLVIIWKEVPAAAGIFGFSDIYWNKEICRCPKCRLVFDY